MIQIVTANGTAEREVISAMRARAASANAAIDRAAAEILEQVQENGFAAVRDYSVRFDKAEPREIGAGEFDVAYAACYGGRLEAMDHAAA